MKVLATTNRNKTKYANRINYIIYKLKKVGIVHMHDAQNTFKPTIAGSTKVANVEIFMYLPDIVYTHDHNYDMDCILLNAVEYLDIPEILADSAKLMLSGLWNNNGYYNFRNIPYELVSLGCLLYSCDVHLPDNIINFKELINIIYSNTDKRMRQLNRAYIKISELHGYNTGETVKLFSHAENIALMKNYTLRHKNAHNT